MNHSHARPLIHFFRLAVCMCPLLLGACSSDMKQSLGLGKEAPDEFVVVSRPPLTVPPDFELRPPSSASDKPVTSTETNARDALFGTTTAGATTDAASLTTLRAPNVDTAVPPVIVSTPPSGPTASFLNKAGADQANPDIRQTLSLDSQKPTDAAPAPTLYDEVVGQQKAESVVDPQKETARIHDDEAAGKPVTDGDTAVVPPENKSVLDRIF